MSISDWSLVPIGSVCDGIFDGPHATPPKTDHGPVFLGISSLINGRIVLTETEHVDEEFFKKWTRRVVPSSGDLVFSYETRLGEGAMIPDGLRCCLGRRMALARPDVAKVDPRFLLYAFLSPAFQETIRKHTVHGSTVDRIPLLQFPEFLVPLPDLSEQRDIAAVLGSLDDKIEQNRRTGRKLEELARAVFKAWFVDFEPVKAKAAGATAFPGMPPAAFATLPNTLKDSPIGPVPEGWEVGTLSDIADVIMGTSPPSSTYNDEAIGVALINGPVEYGERFPLRLKWTTAPVKKASDGDLIFCVRGSTTGRRVISDGIYGLGRGVCAIRGKAASQPFVNALVDFDLPRLLGGTTGSVFPSLSAPTIKGFGIVSPPLVFIRAYCEHSARLLEAANSGARESAKLATLRDYLLPRLLSGRVRVAGAGIDAHAAAAGGADHDQGRHAARHDGDRLTARGSAAGRKAD